MAGLDELRAMVDGAIARRIFPGAVVYLARGNEVVAHEAFGTTAYRAEYSRPVTVDTLYDVASLTKLFTATAFLIAAREADVAASIPLSRFFTQFQTSDKAEITLRDLLQHASGIEIAIQDLTEYSPAEWINHIAAAPLHARPRDKVLYSCTNYFLLARVIERLAGIPLDQFIDEKIFQPLAMNRSAFRPLDDFSVDSIAPTEIDETTGVPWHGVVHDEAARAWHEYSGQSSCGNAGLFTTVFDLASFAQMWCNDGVYNDQQILTGAEIRAALNDTLPESEPPLKRGWSWQVDARFYMSEKAPPGSIGHAGFTGPTIWLHRDTGHICTILNNRVYPTRHEPERFPLHRRIARWLMEYSQVQN